MRIALISDVHSNLPALEAVLAEIRRHNVDRIISLGDQVNLGPSPRETLALLRAEGITCLHGNHERYILCVMANERGYEGANFNSLRYNASLLTAGEITFAKELRFGSVILTHAMPGDDRFPVHEVDQALPRLQAMRFNTPTHILCGHGHNPTYYALPNLTVQSIGAVGSMDDGLPGCAPYVIATIERDNVVIRPHYAHYDVRRIKPLLLSSGMADFCPVMARIVCMQMTHNRDFLVDFVTRARALSASKGEAIITPETWNEADRLYPWADGKTAAQFWRHA